MKTIFEREGLMMDKLKVERSYLSKLHYSLIKNMNQEEVILLIPFPVDDEDKKRNKKIFSMVPVILGDTQRFKRGGMVLQGME